MDPLRHVMMRIPGRSFPMNSNYSDRNALRALRGDKRVEDLIQRAAAELTRARHAIALTGAGISTESGIPDYRGRNGVWTKNPEAERKAYEVYDQFKADPKKYWEERLDPQGPTSRLFAVLGEMGKFGPNAGHYALAELEKMGILKCIITQNVDGLHEKAGSKNVIEFHGGINKFRCMLCNKRFRRDELDFEKMKIGGTVPPYCQCGGVIKDDGVFFGEPIPSDVIQRSQKEAWECDLMLICGTSAVVYPFAGLPETVNQGTRIIEVNADRTPLTGRVSDYLIQGKTGEILPKIVEEVKSILKG
jgi:NAD-dependent deacetylase